MICLFFSFSSLQFDPILKRKDDHHKEDPRDLYVGKPTYTRCRLYLAIWGPSYPTPTDVFVDFSWLQFFFLFSLTDIDVCLTCLYVCPVTRMNM